MKFRFFVCFFLQIFSQQGGVWISHSLQVWQPRLLRQSIKLGSLVRVYRLFGKKLSKGERVQSFSSGVTTPLDMVDTKFYKPPKVKTKRSAPKNTCHVSFDNKGIEMINLSWILNLPSVVETIPSIAKHFETPTVLFSLNDPISSKIFNFNKFVSSLNLPEFIKDNSIIPCHCKDSPYQDKHHKHIISGDLRIVTDNKLRKLFSKRPKFCEPQNIDWVKARESINTGITACVANWCTKHKINKKVLLTWAKEVMSMLIRRLIF